MSSKVISGIGSTPIDLLSLVRTPANSKVMLCFSNESSDDGVIIEQSFTSTTGGNDKVVVNRLGRGKSLSIMLDISNTVGFSTGGLSLRTLTDDSYVNLTMCESSYIPEFIGSYDINSENDVLVYFFSIWKNVYPYVFRLEVTRRQLFAVKDVSRERETLKFYSDAVNNGTAVYMNIVTPTEYIAYQVAGRGYRTGGVTTPNTSLSVIFPGKSFSGSWSGGGFSSDQGISFSATYYGDYNANIGTYYGWNEWSRVNEYPYSHSYSTSFTSGFRVASEADPININSSYTPPSGTMFLIEPSVWVNDKIRPLNFVSQSGISALGAISQSYIEFDNPDDLNSLKASTPMVKVTQNSEEHFELTSFSNDKIKSFAVDIKTLSKNYPYSVAFSSPIMTGITFKSDTEILVHIKDRTTKFNYDHFGKLLRFAVGYDSVSNKLWINGVEQNIVSQGTVAVGSTAITKVGLDVKDAGITATEYAKPTDNALNIGGLVLFSNVVNQAFVENDFEYAKILRDFYGQPVLTSKIMTDLYKIDDWLRKVNS